MNRRRAENENFKAPAENSFLESPMVEDWLVPAYAEYIRFTPGERIYSGYAHPRRTNFQPRRAETVPGPELPLPSSSLMRELNRVSQYNIHLLLMICFTSFYTLRKAVHQWPHDCCKQGLR